MDNKTRKQIELLVIRLENDIKRQLQILSLIYERASEEQVNSILDRVNRNKETVEKLKRGLTEGD